MSYIDDIVLFIASTSLRKNIKILEREVQKLYQLGATNTIEFNLAKIELIYFIISKEVSSRPLLLPNKEVV